MRNRGFRHSNLPKPALQAPALRALALRASVSPRILHILSILVLVIVLIIMGR